MCERDRKRNAKKVSDIQMKNKCQIKILKKKFEEITESSVNDKKCLRKYTFYMFLHQHAYTLDFICHI